MEPTNSAHTIKAVILDFDDTLFMTEYVSWEMENETAHRIGQAPMSREAHLANWGKPIAEAILERLPGVDSEGFFKEFPLVLREYVVSGHLDQLSQSNAAALQTLKASGYELYAVTSRHLIELDHLMTPSHQLAAYLEADRIFHRDNSPYLKPDPRAFDGVLKFSGHRPAECLYVGDSVTDCQAAKGAGMVFVACLESGLRHRDDFAGLAPPPDSFIAAFADLPGWLTSTRATHA